MTYSLSTLFEICSKYGFTEIEISNDPFSGNKYYAFLRCLGVWTPSYYTNLKRLKKRITDAGFVYVCPIYLGFHDEQK